MKYSTRTWALSLYTSIMVGPTKPTWDHAVWKFYAILRHRYVFIAHLQKYHGNTCDPQLHSYYVNSHESLNTHMVKCKLPLKYTMVGYYVC